MSLDAMSPPAAAPPWSVFTFESRTHCLSVLGHLDQQRRHHLLCDVTVTVDGRSFPAHRSVLAACSEYFANAASKHLYHGAILSLPLQVTAAGFEPLLKFAYTSKLLFSKRDVLEVRSAASILGFRDLDHACFDFLLPKFFSCGRSSALFPGNLCCKKECKRWLSKENDGPPNDIGDNDPKPVSESTSDQGAGRLDYQSVIGTTGIKKSDRPEETNDAKFQLDCCTEEALDLPAGPAAPLSGHSAHGCEDQSESTVENHRKAAAVHGGGSGKATEEEPVEPHQLTQKSCRSDQRAVGAVADDVEASGKWETKPPVPVTHLRDRAEDRADHSGASATPGQTSPGLILHHPLPELSRRWGGSSAGPVETFVPEVEADGENCRAATLTVASRSEAEEERSEGREEAVTLKREPDLGGIEPGRGFPSLEEVPGDGARERSGAEMEVAEHLAEGLSTGRPPLLLPVHRGSVGSAPGPFRQDLGPERAESCEIAGMSPARRGPPCVSPLNSGEEVDSETESEGDDLCALEKARQVRLPFSVEFIVDLSKNDFQQLLKQHALNLEQLEFVHDMRRRSKNRMAAQRCRKRKLDCIYNLECEINKLRTEKQRMLAEQGGLHQLKIKSWQALSTLCHKMCSEASLLPEQLQVLAKYTSADCPLASLIPHMDATLPWAQASLSACASDPDVNEAYPWRWSNPSGDVFGPRGILRGSPEDL